MKFLLLALSAGLASTALANPLNPARLPNGRGPSTHAEELGYDGGPAEIERAQYGNEPLRSQREDLEYTHGGDECLSAFLDGMDEI